MGSKEYKHFTLKFSKNLKYPKNDFLISKWPKMIPQSVKMSIFLTEKFNFLVIYQPLELKIKTKVGLLWSKTMPKHSFNNSKTSLKKSKKRIFDLKNDQNTGVNMAKSVYFRVNFRSTSSIFGSLVMKKN